MPLILKLSREISNSPLAALNLSDVVYPSENESVLNLTTEDQSEEPSLQLAFILTSYSVSGFKAFNATPGYGGRNTAG